MTFPAFYNPARIATLYEPELQTAYLAGRAAAHTPASADNRRILAWLVDVQVDFVYPAPIGRLPVPGALDDTRRLVEWIYGNVHQITQIAASLDTHTPQQIFYPTWWKNPAGDQPVPYTVITADDVQAGRWIPTRDTEWSRRYVHELEQVGKKQLMIWPFHCMEGTSGRSLHPALAEAIMFHAGARQTDPIYIPKGTIPYTEYYSVVEPEVKYPDHPDGGKNLAFLNLASGFDIVYVTGEARSHCVLETIDSVVRHFDAAPDIRRRFRFINDTTSSIPGFEVATEKRLNEIASQGVTFVRSTDELDLG